MADRDVARNRGRFYIDGLTQAKANVAALPEAFKEVVRETLEVGSRIILHEAGQRVPVRYGALKRSLGRNVREDGLQIAIGSGDWKAKFQEFGTNDTPRQAFLYPAYRLGAKYIRAQMKRWAVDAATKVTVRGKVSKAAKAK